MESRAQFYRDLKKSPVMLSGAGRRAKRVALRSRSIPIASGLSGSGDSNTYPAFFRTFVPMRNNFRTVPVGNRFISSYNSVTASKNPAIASNRSRV